MYEISGKWKPGVLTPSFCNPKSGIPKYDKSLLYLTEFAK